MLSHLESQIDRPEGVSFSIALYQQRCTFEIVHQPFDEILMVGHTKATVTTSPGIEPTNDAIKGAFN